MVTGGRIRIYPLRQDGLFVKNSLMVDFCQLAMFATKKKYDSTNFYFFAFALRIFSAEPFDRTNTARSVYDPMVFEKIIDVFRMSHDKLVQTGDLNSILGPDPFLHFDHQVHPPYC